MTPTTAGWCWPSGADPALDSRTARRYGPRVLRSHLRLPTASGRRSRGLLCAVAILTCVALGTTACGGSSSAAPSTATASGPVDVLYAGSLVGLMEKQVGPGFGQATGYSFRGFSGGSRALAAQIKGKVRAADVFVSASPAADQTLMGSGGPVTWYATFASSPLVLGYNPTSRFAADLTNKPWYSVLTEPGFLLGTTDPATDPKGKLAAQALTATATSQHLPALGTLATDQDIVFPEETLVSRLQSGQLDAGFLYSSEAKAAGIPTVPVTGQDLKATYTVTVVGGAPHETGAEAFVRHLLGPQGLAAVRQDGFTLTTPPTVTGSGVPAGLADVLPGK
jgi:molybdate/tungstate transport system substrate-binding protein